MEVLLAAFILVSVFFAIGMVSNDATSVDAFSRNSMVAKHLLLGDVEMVKNIRDTNRLLEPGNSDCWLRPDPSKDCTLPVAGNNYVLVRNDSGQPVLTESFADDLDIEKGQADDVYRLYIDNNNLGMYTSKKTLDPSKFYHSVKVEKADKETVVFSLKIQWNEGVKTRTLQQAVVLKNYF